MPVRIFEKAWLTVSFTAGAALNPGTITGDARTLLITFIGLFSASVLPTVSLLINSMSSTGRSVQSTDKLMVEIEAAIDALFFLFGCVVLAVATLVMLAIQPPEFLTKVPYLTSEILPRFGQAVVVTALTIIIMRAGQIPAILRRSLKVRHEIAIAEARRKIADNAPEVGAMKKTFANHPDFGKVVDLNDIQGRN